MNRAGKINLLPPQKELAYFNTRQRLRALRKSSHALTLLRLLWLAQLARPGYLCYLTNVDCSLGRVVLEMWHSGDLAE